MAIWQDQNGALHDDMVGEALALPSWPQGMAQLTDEQATALQNPAPSATQLAVQARAQRNAYLDRLSVLYTRHKSQIDLSLTPSFTDDQFKQVLQLMESLRNIPQQEGFPETVSWPIAPDFIHI